MKHAYMLFMDSKDGRVRQMWIGSALIESIFLIAFVAVVVLAVICSRNSKKIDLLEEETAKQQEEIVKLTEENADLVSLREELTDKVTILSDTINQKVEEEEAMEEARARAHMPVGFPMSSSASLAEAEGENPMVKLSGAEVPVSLPQRTARWFRSLRTAVICTVSGSTTETATTAFTAMTVTLWSKKGMKWSEARFCM